jgi:hypothetical protein
MGSCSVTYHPSEVSGIETIQATGDGFGSAQAMVTVQVPELINLADIQTNFFRLTGQTGTHPDNHWGTPNTVANIQLVALDLFDVFEATLGINDMSLPLGGLFDINGTWKPPHSSHRKGTSVDIDRTGCVDPNLDGGCRQILTVPRVFISDRCLFHGTAGMVREATYHCEWAR